MEKRSAGSTLVRRWHRAHGVDGWRIRIVGRCAVSARGVLTEETVTFN